MKQQKKNVLWNCPFFNCAVIWWKFLSCFYLRYLSNDWDLQINRKRRRRMKTNYNWHFNLNLRSITFMIYVFCDADVSIHQIKIYYSHVKWWHQMFKNILLQFASLNWFKCIAKLFAHELCINEQTKLNGNSISVEWNQHIIIIILIDLSWFYCD